MCGIAGRSLREPENDTGAMRELGATLAHRGPDGHGDFTWKYGGLAHTRLSIIDLASGAQPLHNETKDIVLVCNGEIYNFVELRAELEALGHVFATNSDSETIIHAYEAWGTECLNRLHGMFAFALYDCRTEELLLARDRFGIKPLFLSSGAYGVHFASEQKALLPTLVGKAEVEPEALLQFLQSQYSSGRKTMIKGIWRLLPGEAIVLKRGQIVRQWRYYEVPLGQLDRSSKGELFERFDSLMEIVMREHMRSDVPFGLFLSGGIDSAVLAMMLQKMGSVRLRTFSVGFSSTEAHSELELARHIATRFDTEHTALTVTPAQLLARLPYSIWAADDLLGDTACLPTSLLAERAGSALKVVFSGEGGDEVFAGYARYRASGWKRFWRRMRSPGLGGMRSGGQAVGYENLFGDALSGCADAWALPQSEAWDAATAAHGDVQRMQAVDLATWLPDDLLVKGDRMLMSFALEGRVPYLDHRVVEFGMSLPDELKVNRRFGKLFLRAWGERSLPKDHMWQRKKGFTVPVLSCLTSTVLAKLNASLPAHPAIRYWFSAERVRALLKRVSAGGDGGRMIWALMQFAIWHNIFIDGNCTRPDVDTRDLADVL